MIFTIYNIFRRLYSGLCLTRILFWKKNIQTYGSKNIVLLCDHLNAGGIERLVITRSEYFKNQQCNVDIVLLNKIGDFLSLVPYGVGLYELDKINRVSNFVNYIKTKQPDIIIASNLDSIIVALYAKIFLRSNIKLIVTIDTIYTTRFIFLKKAKIKRVVSLMRYLKVLLFLADQILVVSDIAAADIKKFSIFSINHKILVEYPTINTELIKKSQLEQIDHPWILDKDCKIILIVGRLVSIKDHSTLIKSFKIIRNQYNIKLIILGDGILKNELIKLVKELNIEEHVLFPGISLNPYAYMSNSDVVVVSSIVEGFCLVAIESMICGTPVVGTDCGSVIESLYLSHEKYMYIAPVGNTEALANVIINMLNNPIPPDILLKKVNDFYNKREKQYFVS